MAITFKLPRIADIDAISVLATPVVGDTVMATGVLTIKDEAGSPAIVVKAADLLNFQYDAYAAGTANIVDVDLTGVTIVNNGVYVLTVYAPFVQNFFGGGQESGAIFQTRTYTVSLGGTTGSPATVAQLQALFVARINADVNAYFTASAETGDVVRITADNAGFGPLTINAPAGATVADQTAWASPVGTPAEVLSYVNNALLVNGAGYNRYIITYRKVIRHNIVNGLQVIKPVQAIVYLDKDNAGTAAVVTRLTGLLDGSYATTAAIAATYLGCPAV
jgi:hypothetical protein